MADKIKVDSRFDIKGNYQPSDSEDEYSPTEKKLLEKVRKRKHDDESEEDVYAFSDSEEDSVKNDLGIADSDVEGQEKSDDDLPDSKAWGKKRKSFYSTDFVDQDYGGFQDDEEAALMEEEEAKNIQKRLMDQLADEDFSLDFFSTKPSTETEAKETVIKSDLSQMSKRQKLQLLEKESPEFSGLIEDFKTKLSVAKDDLHPVLELLKDGKLPNCPASSFVKTNYKLILNYCTNISLYLLLKSQKINIQNHPVIKRLYQYRQMLNKMEPIYTEVIKPQIRKILNAVSNNIELHITEMNEDKSRKRKNGRDSSESQSKKLKIISVLEKDDGEDTGVSDDDEEYEGNDFFGTQDIAKADAKINEESEESGFSDNEEEGPKEQDNSENKPSTSQTAANEVNELGGKREITYQIAKNKGLTPHRKKEQRNPRVKHKLKYKKAKIRRKGAVREPRKEITRYGGESSGIKANLKKSIKIK